MFTQIEKENTISVKQTYVKFSAIFQNVAGFL